MPSRMDAGIASPAQDPFLTRFDGRPTRRAIGIAPGRPERVIGQPVPGEWPAGGLQALAEPLTGSAVPQGKAR